METIIDLEAASSAASMETKRPTPIVRDAHVLFARGIDALERDRIEEAVGLLRQMVEVEADSFLGHLALGVALTKALEISQAQRELEIAIDLEPDNFYGHLRLAEMFLRVGVPTRAKEELRIALDVAQTAEQKKTARDMLDASIRRDAHRAWRPDFMKLLGKSHRKP